MSQRQSLIRFKSGDEQPVVAKQVAVDEECLLFLDAQGQLTAWFNLTEVAD